jgi:hypothetical protein
MDTRAIHKLNFKCSFTFRKNAAEASEDEDFYYETRYRFMPWFIGIATGYIMQMPEKNSPTQVRECPHIKSRLDNFSNLRKKRTQGASGGLCHWHLSLRWKFCVTPNPPFIPSPRHFMMHRTALSSRVALHGLFMRVII